jgi:hypothetical protein
MHTVYEIAQDELVMRDIPIFTDLGRAHFALNLILQEELEQAQKRYHDVFVMPVANEHAVDNTSHLIVCMNGQLEYTSFAIYERSVNTATLGDSHS